MKVRQIHEEGGLRTLAVAFEMGEEVSAGLEDLARRERLTGASFTAIGAFQDVVLAYFDFDRKDYERIPVAEQVEVLALAGTIALKNDAPSVHAHVVVGKRDGTAHGGHLMEAHVRPILEVTIVESPAYLRRRHDERSGLSLLDPSA